MRVPISVRPYLLAVATAALAGCPGTPPADVDAALAPDAAAPAADAAQAVDAGAPPDAGTIEADAGAAPDAAPGSDAGEVPVEDASTQLPDASPVPADASSEPADAASAQPDAHAAGLDAAGLAGKDAQVVVWPDAGGPAGCALVDCAAECVVYVDLSVATPGDGSTPGTAAATVQDGIDLAAAAAGECCTCEVRVAQGTYLVHQGAPEDTVQLRPRVQVLGGWPAGFLGSRDLAAHATVLDGAGGVYHVVTGADDAVLDGFTVTGGRAAFSASAFDPRNFGGGIINRAVSPLVSNCTFDDNDALSGGAAYNYESAASFVDCVFTDNVATDTGGALDNRHGTVTVKGGSFSGNSAARGGAFHLAALDASEISGIDFVDNSATASGGVAHVRGQSTPGFQSCRFLGNGASQTGGALHSEDGAAPTVVNSLFNQNTAGGKGAALYNDHAAPVVLQSTIYGNFGFTVDSMVHNQDSSPVFTNCLLWHRDDLAQAKPPIVNAGTSKPTVTYSDVQLGCTKANGCTTDETGNLSFDPMVLDPSGGDFHPSLTSPLLDRGSQAALPAGISKDLAGGARVGDGDHDGTAVVDIGAFEFVEPKVVYVDLAATAGAKTGASWANAFTDLSSAFASIGSAGAQVWVAKGTYKPPSATAALPVSPATAVLGGFNPAAGITGLDKRNPATQLTVITGDLNGDGAGEAAGLLKAPSNSPMSLDGLTLELTASGTAIAGGGGPVALRKCVLQNHQGKALSGTFSTLTLKDLQLSSNQGPTVVSATLGYRFEMNGGQVISNHSASGTFRLQSANASFPASALFSGSFFGDNRGNETGAITVQNVGLEVVDCQFHANRVPNVMGEGDITASTTATGGGAIRAASSPLSIRGSTFMANEVFAKDSHLSLPCASQFLGDGSRAVGGAVMAYGAPVTISTSTFENNRAKHLGDAPCTVNWMDPMPPAGGAPALAAGAGGAVFVKNGDLTVRGSTFRNNGASVGGVRASNSFSAQGGAVWVAGEGSASFENSQFYSNQSGELNGGWSLSSPMGGVFARVSQQFLVGSLFSASDVLTQIRPTFDSSRAPAFLAVNCTSTSSQLVELWDIVGPPPLPVATFKLANSIFWGSAGFPDFYVNRGGTNQPWTFTVDRNTFRTGIQSGAIPLVTPTNTSTADPMFVAFDDFRLQPGSPAIDTGDSSHLLPSMTTDLAGKARVQGARVDRGAYEATP